MKLVDILARVLTEWPSGHPRQVACISQSLTDTELYFLDSKNNAIWGRYLTDQKAEDAGAGAPVTRAQWQAAVDALKAKAEVPQWTGKGLPPVGADAEYNIGDGWYPCNIRYVLERSGEFSYALVAWCPHLEKDQYLSFDKGCKFRKSRTPEQKAAEEREREVELAIQMINQTLFCPNSIAVQNGIRHAVGEMIAAGYRKFEIVDKDDGEGEV